MMTAEQLKASILQLAMQGKLVEQRPEEGTGEELYKKIQEEKRRLIKTEKVKAEKKYSAITIEEISFDIPDTWVWVRLADIVFNRGQKKPENTFSYIDIGSINNKSQKLNDDENIIEAHDAPSRARKIVGIGDVIYSTVRPYLHNMCIIDRDFSYEPIASTGFATMTCYEGLYNKFLFFYLLSPDFDRYANDTENSKGVAYPAINDQKLYKALVPLPPLAEQKRIVAKIEELMPFVEQYAAASTKLNTLNTTFPEMMKKSILQEAVQGKLVPQDPNDEPASVLLEKIGEEKKRLIKEGKIKKQKPLPEITEDEIPFDIPESWEWVRLGIVITDTEAGKSPQCKNRPANNDEWGVIKTTAIQDGYFLKGENKALPEGFEIKEAQVIHVDDLLITRAGPQNRTGITCIVDEEPEKLILSDKTVRLAYLKGLVNHRFLMYVLKSPTVQKLVSNTKSGMASSQVNISQDKMKLFIIPFPPLNEQNRIVEAIEKFQSITENATRIVG